MTGFRLGYLLAKAARRSEEYTVEVYCGGPFPVEITSRVPDDMPKGMSYFFRFLCDDEDCFEPVQTIGSSKEFENGLRDLFDNNGMGGELNMKNIDVENEGDLLALTEMPLQETQVARTSDFFKFVGYSLLGGLRKCFHTDTNYSLEESIEATAKEIFYEFNTTYAVANSRTEIALDPHGECDENGKPKVYYAGREMFIPLRGWLMDNVAKWFLKKVDYRYTNDLVGSIEPREYIVKVFDKVYEMIQDRLIENETKKPPEKPVSKKDALRTKYGIHDFYESKLSEAGYSTFRNHIGELDSFYDPYKPEPAEVPYEPAYNKVDWYGRLAKGLDFSTPEGLEKAFAKYFSYSTSDFVHDIEHDGDRQGAKDAKAALAKLYSNILAGCNELGLTSADVTNPDFKKYLGFEEVAKAKEEAAEKRKAARAANAKNKVQKYIDELKTADLPDEVRELFNDEGYYKERRSYGVIKNYFDKPYGKALKAIWKDEFAN